MVKKSTITSIIYLLSILFAFVAVLFTLDMAGIIQQTELGEIHVSDDGMYFYGDSSYTLTGYNSQAMVFFSDGQLCGVMNSGTYLGRSFLIPTIRERCGYSNPYTISNKYVYSPFYSSTYWYVEGSYDPSTGQFASTKNADSSVSNDLLMGRVDQHRWITTKDFKTQDFAIDKTYSPGEGSRMCQNQMRIKAISFSGAPIEPKMGSNLGSDTSSNSGSTSIMGSVNEVDIGTFEGCGKILIRHDDIDSNILIISFQGNTIGEVNIGSLSNIHYAISSVDDKQVTWKNPRYKLMQGCVLKPNEGFIADYITGSAKLGISVNSTTFGMHYAPRKFCFETPAFLFQTNPFAVDSTNDAYRRLINGSNVFVDAGKSLLMYYIVDCSIYPDKCGCPVNTARSVRSGLCIPFVMTGDGAINPETGDWEAQTNYAVIDETPVTNSQEVITKILQCQVDDDCYVEGLCSGGVFSCNILTNRCIMQKPCDTIIEYEPISTIIYGENITTLVEVEKIIEVPVNVTQYETQYINQTQNVTVTKTVVQQIKEPAFTKRQLIELFVGIGLLVLIVLFGMWHMRKKR